MAVLMMNTTAVLCVAAALLVACRTTALVSSEESGPPAPSFSTKPGRFQVTQGESIVLPCVISHKGPHVVVWKRQRRVISARQTIVARDDRFSLESGNNLRIDGVRPDDQSSYTCSLDTHPLLELTHQLHVLYSPVVSVQPSSGHLVVDRGNSAELSCDAVGNPAPKLLWRRRSGLLPSGEEQREGKLYKIAKVSRQMAGVYECVADNGLGRPSVAAVSLQVHYPPEVEVERSAVYTGEGFDAQLVCFVFADPVAEVRWLREGGPLTASRHLPTDDRADGTRHVLHIRPVRTADFGTYSCQASNALGTAVGRMVLSGTPERARVTSSPMGTAPDSYQLAWQVHSCSPILEYKVAYRPSKTNTTRQASWPAWREVLVPATAGEVVDGTVYHQTVPLDQLRPATLYDLYVQARNRHGWNAVSVMFHFSTLARGEALESRHFSGAGELTAPQPAAVAVCLVLLRLTADAALDKAAT